VGSALGALLDLVATEVGHVVEVRDVPVLGLRALGLFSPMTRSLAEMSYEFEQSFVLDTSKYEATFDTPRTPLVTAVAETVVWHRAQASNT